MALTKRQKLARAKRLLKEASEMEDDYEEREEEEIDAKLDDPEGEDPVDEIFDDEDDEDVEDKGYASKAHVQRLERTVSKVLKASERTAHRNKKLAKHNQSLRKKLKALESRLAKDDDYPEDDVEFPDGTEPDDVQHDPTEDEVEDEPSDEGTTRPAEDTTGTEGAFTGKGRGGISGRIAQLEKQVEQLASTPTPTGWGSSPAGQIMAKSADQEAGLQQLIMKAITEDRKNVGNGTLAMGMYKAGTGDKDARRATGQFMAKMFGQHSPDRGGGL